jgi:phosphatidylinositol-3-phosphatase
VTLLIMENRDYDRVIGNADAPYINGTLVPHAALMTNSHAIGHPSEPNYIALFSGDHLIGTDKCPVYFNAPNLASELLSAGVTFGGYSESMPHDGYRGCFPGLYDRDHNPWADFKNVPATVNLVYERFPEPPPTVTIVVPNLRHGMHDSSTIRGDHWLSLHLPRILKWEMEHDGLFILTWDEAAPDRDRTDHVATLLIGPMVRPGSYAQSIDHYSVLHTIQTIAGVPCIAHSCRAPILTGMWK